MNEQKEEKKSLTYWQMWSEVFKLLTWKRLIVLWILLNSFALITSYAEINNLNSKGLQRTEEVWPFVEYLNTRCEFIESHESIERGRQAAERMERINSYNRAVGNNIIVPGARELEGEWTTCFHGVFVDYDWSEFALYVLLPLILIITNKLLFKRNS
jgi:hypothetical protein